MKSKTSRQKKVQTCNMDLHVRRQTLKFVSYLVRMCVFSHFVIDSSIRSVIQFKVRVKYFYDKSSKLSILSLIHLKTPSVNPSLLRLSTLSIALRRFTDRVQSIDPLSLKMEARNRSTNQ